MLSLCFLTIIGYHKYRTVKIFGYRTLKIEISYQYEMKNSYQLKESNVGDWEITVGKGASTVIRQFDTLCLYEFLEMHLESRSPDPKKALAFVKRWGALNNDPITRVPFTEIELILRSMLAWSEELSPKNLKRVQSLFESGIASKYFDKNLQINLEGIGKNVRPVLRPKNLQTAILLAGLVRGRQDYVRCHLHELLGEPRDENCPIGCWARKEGRPGRSTRVWGEDRCRAFFNRNKQRRNWK